MPRARKPPNAYPKANRVDLNQAKAPVVAPGSVPYGEAGRITESTKVAPLANEQATLAAVLAKAMATAPPPEGGVARPSARPNEPVTQGLPSGAGAGPEVMIGTRQANRPTIADTYDMLYEQSGNFAFAKLAAQARHLGL
jgi:hypothetical protein